MMALLHMAGLENSECILIRKLETLKQTNDSC
jgi:hypothetical protein